MEKIYTIPVNEAFEKQSGCPFCTLREMLEKNELDTILGASMMEPDIRIKTNELGFCARHYRDMFRAKNRLSLALMMESHLDSVAEKMKTPKFSFKEKIGAVAKNAEGISKTCYLCEKTEHHLGKMFETACLLWDADKEFVKKFQNQPYFCLPCYSRLLETAKHYIPKKKLDDFFSMAQEIETSYIKKLREDISWFCKKFDYRYTNEPWGDAKDAVERTILFLSQSFPID